MSPRLLIVGATFVLALLAWYGLARALRRGSVADLEDAEREEALSGEKVSGTDSGIGS